MSSGQSGTGHKAMNWEFRREQLDRETYELTPTVPDVLYVLAAHEPVSRDWLAEAMGASRTSLGSSLGQLRNHGIAREVPRTAGPLWELVPEARARLVRDVPERVEWTEVYA